jgi:plasmid maintenance system antidote protein VapI
MCEDEKMLKTESIQFGTILRLGRYLSKTSSLWLSFQVDGANREYKYMADN